MKNKAKIFIAIAIAIIAIIFFVVFRNRNTERHKVNTENLVNIADNEEIFDECTEEWEEYNNELQRAFEEASSTIDNSTHYLVKSDGEFIKVYYLDENNENVLYKKTDISIDYLSPEDVEKLEKGIEVVGSESLNKILEDYE